MADAARVRRVAGELRRLGVSVRDLEVLDALLDLVGEGKAADEDLIAWLTELDDVCRASIAHAARQDRR